LHLTSTRTSVQYIVYNDYMKCHSCAYEVEAFLTQTLTSVKIEHPRLLEGATEMLSLHTCTHTEPT